MRKCMLAGMGALALAVAILAPSGFLSSAEAAKKIQTLLITGDDVSSHNWKEQSAAIKDVLTEAGKFEVTVVEGFSILDKKDDLKKYDLIAFTMFNNKKAPISDQAKENLLSFVKDGKGITIHHLASASFQDWKEWNDMCGRYWVRGSKNKDENSGHGPRSEFESKIVDKDSPITKGMKDFKTDDELYAKLKGDAKINVLVSADSTWSKKTEPLAFTLDYGKGRVFHCAYGHDGKAIKIAPVAALIARGSEWAATGKVAE
ncbi:MAG: ThuA domain-containing protein [Candidatus Sumerlaeota bacterium]|nr:ThuA domain-containing protein [Candidatus Sumerlaeota bacterium]